jgi:hypothetical protein
MVAVSTGCSGRPRASSDGRFFENSRFAGFPPEIPRRGQTWKEQRNHRPSGMLGGRGRRDTALERGSDEDVSRFAVPTW